MWPWNNVAVVIPQYLSPFHTHLRGFPFTLRTNTVGHLWESNHKWPTYLSTRYYKNHAIFSDACVDHYILLLKYLSNQFYNKRLKRFSKTNSTDPRQKVPLKLHSGIYMGHNLQWVSSGIGTGIGAYFPSSLLWPPVQNLAQQASKDCWRHGKAHHLA